LCQSLAGMPVSEKNRYIRSQAFGGRRDRVSSLVSLAGRDNFGDNSRYRGLPVNESLSYT